MADEPRDNLQLWNSVESTDPDYVKKANNGRYNFTAIDATYQLKEATKLWGPYGGDWGLRSLQFTTHEHEKGKLLALIAEFYSPLGSFPVAADVPLGWREDSYKKAITSARSKALSWLGFNADVFLGKYDDDQYVSEMQTKFADEDELRAKVLQTIRTASTDAMLESCRDRLEDLRGNNAITNRIYDEGLQAIEEQGKELTNGVV